MASTLNSIAWKFSESILSQLVSLVVSIIIARVLGPEAYGIVALVVVFTTIAQVLVDGGFNSALIQKKNADDVDFSTVFYFSLIFSVIIYIALFIASPYIADFYGSQYTGLDKVFRVLGLSLIVYSINGVQTAYVQKRMMFKNFFWAKLVGTTCSGIIGIIMAYSGFGVWALVAQQLSASIINTFTLYLITRKSPILAFSLKRLKGLLSFGINVLASNLLVTGYKELRALIIGKVYSASDLALYDRGNQYPNLIVANVNSTLSAVLYPKMSMEQDNLVSLKSYLRKSLRISTYILSPLLIGLAAAAEPLVRVLLTEKWMACVPFMQILCLTNLFQPLSTINNQAIRAIGKSGTILFLEVIKKSIELITLIAVMRISVMAIVINMLVMAALLNLLFIYPNSKYLGYSFKEQLADIAPGFIMSGIMLIFIYPINWIPMNDVLKICLEVISGVFVYAMMSIITKNKEFDYVKGIVSSRINKQQ